ncbi:hypothetical protein HAX54_019037 [Datura stramonium]|uniref:Uncharacterized protein n=1 Tax=Datura stramonium TaxID=4076 RepID=A0ABS8S1S5_DATST|nr:hypothetical protein [Datura stramonium]
MALVEIAKLVKQALQLEMWRHLRPQVMEYGRIWEMWHCIGEMQLHPGSQISSFRQSFCLGMRCGRIPSKVFSISQFAHPQVLHIHRMILKGLQSLRLHEHGL